MLLLSACQNKTLPANNKAKTAIQTNDVLELKQQNKLQQVTFIGTTVIIILLIIIILQMNRNLTASKENHLNSTIQNQKLQHSLAELERANQNYIRIMRVMAHDLRNPVSGITGIAAMLLDEEEFTQDSKRMLQLIETTGMHSLEMINELLKSGLENENEPIIKEKLDMKELLYDSVELLQFKAIEKEQQIVFESDDAPLMVNVNYEKIWRVINNLIINAIKFSHAGSIIKTGIRLDNDKKHVLISVADNGIGIADKDKGSIFEMFTPAKRVGTNGEQPFGLGLSISKKIVEKHNGRIWFESTPLVGTIFYVQLPC